LPHFAQHQAVRRERAPDFLPNPSASTSSITGTSHASSRYRSAPCRFCDAGDEFRFAHRDSKVRRRNFTVHHHGQVGAAVAHVDDVVVADSERPRESLRAR